jgi:hypothetical protein
MVNLFSKSINLGMLGLFRGFSYMDIGARVEMNWSWSKLPVELLSLVLAEPDTEEAYFKDSGQSTNAGQTAGTGWGGNLRLSPFTR